MVGSLTTGKKKYAAVEQEMTELNEKARRLREELLDLVEKDAEVFEPLSKAYGIPKEDPEREAVMACVLKDAAGAQEDMKKVLEINPESLAHVSGDFSAEGIENKVKQAYSFINPFGI